MQKTIPFLMFVGNQFGKAEEAIKWYISLFPNSEILSLQKWAVGEPGGQEGLIKQAHFTLSGQEYMASENEMDHKFSFTPSISIFVTCESENELDALYAQLLEGGEAMMPAGDYGFSKKFGWVADKYGLSWQLNLPA